MWVVCRDVPLLFIPFIAWQGCVESDRPDSPQHLLVVVVIHFDAQLWSFSWTSGRKLGSNSFFNFTELPHPFFWGGGELLVFLMQYKNVVTYRDFLALFPFWTLIWTFSSSLLCLSRSMLVAALSPPDLEGALQVRLAGSPGLGWYRLPLEWASFLQCWSLFSHHEPTMYLEILPFLGPADALMPIISSNSSQTDRHCLHAGVEVVCPHSCIFCG